MASLRNSRRVLEVSRSSSLSLLADASDFSSRSRHRHWLPQTLEFPASSLSLPFEVFITFGSSLTQIPLYLGSFVQLHFCTKSATPAMIPIMYKKFS